MYLFSFFMNESLGIAESIRIWKEDKITPSITSIDRVCWAVNTITFSQQPRKDNLHQDPDSMPTKLVLSAISTCSEGILDMDAPQWYSPWLSQHFLFEKASELIGKKCTYSSILGATTSGVSIISVESIASIVDRFDPFFGQFPIGVVSVTSILATAWLGVLMYLYQRNIGEHGIVILDRKNKNIELHTSRNIGKLYMEALENIPKNSSEEAFKQEITRPLIAERKNILSEIKGKIEWWEWPWLDSLTFQSHLLNTEAKREGFKNMVREIFGTSVDIKDIPTTSPKFSVKFAIWGFPLLTKLAMYGRDREWLSKMLRNPSWSDALHFVCCVGNMFTPTGFKKLFIEKRELHRMRVSSMDSGKKE